MKLKREKERTEYFIISFFVVNINDGKTVFDIFHLVLNLLHFYFYRLLNVIEKVFRK